MDTCSNCGAPVRPGAKFCTGCGNRLNDVDTSGSGPSGWNETAPVVENPPADEPTVGRVVSTRIVSDGDRADPAPEPTTVASAPPATDWAWGSLETDDPAARVPLTPADEGEPASPDSIARDEPAPMSGPAPNPAPEPFQWSWGASTTTEPADEANANASANGDDSRTIAEPMVGSPPEDTHSYRPSSSETADSPADTNVSDSDAADDAATPTPLEPVADVEANAPAEDQADRDEREAELADAAPPYDWRQSVTYGYEEKSPSKATIASVDATGAEFKEPAPAASVAVADTTEQAGSTTAEARALDLLDELQSLIPTLSGEAAGTQDQIDNPMGDAVNAAIRELDQSRAGVDASGDLRAVLEAAKTRPRDMDAVLDLVGQAGRLIDLLDERDRLAAAIEQAASSLREAT